MKAFFVLLAVAAAVAEPEADPQLLLAGAPLAYHTPYTYIKPQVELKKVEVKPIEYKTVEFKPIEYKTVEIKPVEYKKVELKTVATPLAYNYMPYVYSTPYAHSMVRIAKREAEADPALVYSAALPYAHTYAHAAWPMTYAAHWNYPYTYSAYPWIAPAQVKTLDDATKKVDTPDYANKGKYVAESAGAIHIAKREADPALLYSALPYAHTYAHAAWPMTYAAHWNHPYTYSAYPWIAPAQVKTLDDATKKVDTPDYANKGKYIAESAGAIHIAKREADADPALLYASAFPATYSSWPLTYARTAAWNYPYSYTTPLAYRSAWNWGYHF